jgi:hypothetical protein
MAKAEATVEELVGMIERGELRLPGEDRASTLCCTVHPHDKHTAPGRDVHDVSRAAARDDRRAAQCLSWHADLAAWAAT